MNSQPVIGKISSAVSQFDFRRTINYSSDFDTKINGERVFSPPLRTYSSGKEIHWCIVLCPKGAVAPDSKNNPSIFLANSSHFEVEATFNFSFLTKDLKKVKEKLLGPRLFEPGATWGVLIFAEQSFIADRKNNLIVDGEITIFCQITTKNIQIQEQDSMKNILDGFEKIFLNEKFNDFTVITADERKLPVHKAMLANRSPVFDAMFQNNMIEKSQNSVKIEDVKYEVLLEMFRFIYSNKVYGIEKILCELLYAANKYSIEELRLLCEQTMLSKLDTTNAIGYLIEADRNNCSNIKKIQEFIVKHSSDFVNTLEFRSLITTHPDLTYEIINAIDNRNPSN